MKRLMIIPVLFVLVAPAPARAGMDIWPLDGTLYCSKPSSAFCFRPDLKDKQKQKASHYKVHPYMPHDYANYKGKIYGSENKSGYKLQKPPRAVPDPRVKD